MDDLPINDVLPDIVRALADHGRAVLQAPPGAGKTTGVPPALLDTPGRILMLEPRRLAARAAAERMAFVRGEKVGQTAGYRIRGEARVGPDTRIEVVTEGILTRMLQSDPALPGVGTVIFDEFHERSLNADLGLAMTWQARAVLRPDLRILVMSATLDADPVAAMLDCAPVITARGAAYPVETRWLDRPLPAGAEFVAESVRLVQRAMEETQGGVLVFLPGAPEIHRVADRLSLPPGATLHRLFGAADASAQRAAIAPATDRKVVLATAIAETSLTIDGITTVVDCGRARRARFDVGSGMSRLVIERVSKAEADQRRGRAGRQRPGVAYRLWARAEEGALPAFAPPEIESADLAGLALELAVWGEDPAEMAFLTQPPGATIDAARSLLADLGAVDGSGRITDHGRAMAAMPIHPRLAHMLAVAGKGAAPLAALLSVTDPLKGGPVDLSLRLDAIRGDASRWGDPAALARIRAETRRLAKLAPELPSPMTDTGAMAALAYPDRIGQRRPGDAPRWRLSGGGGAVMEPDQPLARADWLVALDTDGARRDARIRLAAPIAESTLRDLYADRIGQVELCEWSRRDRRVVARQRETLGALILKDDPWRNPPAEALAAALVDGLRELGVSALGFSPAVERLRARAAFVRAGGGDVGDLSDGALLSRTSEWFAPAAGGARTLGALASVDWSTQLLAMLGWEARQTLDRLAPPTYETPLGRMVPIDYAAEGPRIEVRLQELFGVTQHPVVGHGSIPLAITLLSPAGRPVQVTQDLPGFWATSYADVRRDMRGRYPKHPWPEDPSSARPTTRTKPRK